MATVYLARQTSMNRVVALKVLPKNLTQDEAYFKRFEREVNIVAQLEHRSIVPVYDHGTLEGQPFIAMRYMSGGSLDQKLAHGPMRAEDVLNVYAQIAPALDYAHSKNVLHRDLKPSNVLLDETGGAFITDFGIARVMNDASHTPTITTQGIVGTPSYMSPEQAQGQPMDGRSDLYALGVMLFELLTGRRPFMSDTPYSIAVMQVTAAPPSARAINPNISPAVEAVIFKTLKKKPEERYPTAAEMVESLRMAVENPAGFNPHDTQPHRRPISAATQPVPVTPVQPQMVPVFTPPRATPDYMPAPISAPSMPAARPVKRRSGSNLWMSMTIGALIGCGLLTIIGFVIVMVTSQLLDRSNAPTSAATPDTDTVPTTSAGLPLPTAPDDDATDEATAPIGVRDPMDGLLVFVTETQQGGGPVYTQIFTSTLREPLPSQLTTSPYNHSAPAVSPNGQRIAYISDQYGNGDVFVTDFAQATETRVLASPADEYTPTWLPDGSALVFASDTRGDGAYSLLMAPVDGSGEVTVLYSTPNIRASYPAVSPDGTKLAFVVGAPRDASTWEVAILDLTTSELTMLTDNAVRESHPVFSADGQTLYWLSDHDGQSSVWRGDITGVGSARLYNSTQYISGLTISPDGTLLLLAIGGVGDPIGTLHTLSTDGGVAPESLDIAYAQHADWTP